MIHQVTLIVLNLSAMGLFVVALRQDWASPAMLATLIVVPVFFANVVIILRARRSSASKPAGPLRIRILLAGALLYMAATLIALLLAVLGVLEWKFVVGAVVTSAVFLLLYREWRKQSAMHDSRR